MITSRNNPIIREARRLRQGGQGRQSGLFLVEGIHLVGAAIEASWPLERVLYSKDALISTYGRGLVEQLGDRSLEVAASVLNSLCSKEHPQGILAIARRRRQVLDSLVPAVCGVALMSPQDPGNVGTILRTMEAVGATALYALDGGVDPFHLTAVRAAMGACFAIPIVEAAFADFDAWRHSRGLQLIGSSAHARTEYRDFQPGGPWILLLGNEQKGLSEFQQQACDAVVRLPMRGRATSLNLAIAAGILLFEYALARSA